MQQGYKAARDAAQRELTELLGKRTELEKRILHLKETITALNALVGDQPKKTKGKEMPRMTEAIKQILIAAPDAMSPTAIRDKLVASGFSLKAYRNPLASIHVVLKRLSETPNVERTDLPSGSVYRWKKFGTMEWELGGKNK